MKLRLHIPGRPGNRGTTLIELTIAIMAALLIAAASLAMLSQQLSFTRMVRDQNFLLEECPMINNLLSRTLGRIDSYRIYTDLASAQAGGASVLADGKSLLLVFRDGMNRLQYSIIAAEEQPDGRVRLGYYSLATTTWPTVPDWVVSEKADDVVFLVENGVLRIRLTGPNGEQITYSGHTQS